MLEGKDFVSLARSRDFTPPKSLTGRKDMSDGDRCLRRLLTSYVATFFVSFVSFVKFIGKS